MVVVNFILITISALLLRFVESDLCDGFSSASHACHQSELTIGFSYSLPQTADRPVIVSDDCQ